MAANVLLFFLYAIPLLVVLHLFSTPVLRKLRNGPPTPFPCLPVIGHLHLLKEPIHATFDKLANRYGPVFSFRLGSRPLLFVSSPSAVQECLDKNDIVFANRPSGFTVGKYVGNDYTSPIWAPYGPHWRDTRRILAIGMVSSHRLRQQSSVRAYEVGLLVHRVLEVVGMSGGYGVVEMKPLIYDLTMNVITRMIFGMGGDDNVDMVKRLKNMMEKTLKLSYENYVGDLVPYLRWLDWLKERRFRKFIEETETLMQELTKEHRSKVKGTVEHDDGDREKPFLQVLLELQQSDPEYYNNGYLRGFILDLLVAGFDTPATAIQWALSLLLNHPEELKKVQFEIDNYIGNKRLLEESDLHQLPYLHCVINETLRMCPPSPNIVPHESSKDCVIESYHISRGTMLLVNLLALQNDPKLWNDPEIFRPERFEGVDGHKIGFKMMPFGVGKRSCPGEPLAIRVIGLTVGSLIQCFDWERVDKFVDMTQQHRFGVMHKAEPLQARLRPRPTMMELLSHM